ncbi:AMP-binding protein [Gordonia pseudamarae]|jgi:long-chain acyl-CoA synthetase|uniref:Acyl-CoA synthetase n=1 Tax=Gordonia pseudamarae TaxID=2831662 RepID=A0ABX6IIK1_9ACTN|nr:MULTISPECIES: AMP-dependent synthetase/ligase [Gordonia]MBD0022620.1 AMP-binding protein [Gordonia sp. (in: high G+C Gram-positive bacteria)]QHN26821.1 AMP-binding protein [Gordonia pseudamarae]QHN35712.1 AMP-binding protein [Gordonia pseudamarae]
MDAYRQRRDERPTLTTEYSVPADFTIADDANCTDIIFDIAARSPGQAVFLDKRDTQWLPVSAADVVTQVTALAKGFIASGVQPGDRVAILCRTRLEWMLIDVAVWAAGAVPVPIYDSSSTTQIEWILTDSGATTIVLEDAGHRAEFDAAPSAAGVRAFQIDAGDGLGAIAELTELGARIGDDEVAARRASLRSSDPGVLIYTSGTTGRPKGCVLTHANLLSECRAALSTGIGQKLEPGKRLLMFLPLAHVLAHAITLVAIDGGASVGFTSDIKNLVPEFGNFRPSAILSVPRVFEKVFNTARQGAHDSGKGKIFDAAADTAIAYSQAQQDGGAGIVLKGKHLLFDKLVYGKLRTALGGQCEMAISGGAPLGARLGHFFSGVGIPVYEGYGLTETTAAFSVNTPGAVKIGTVGRPLPGNSARIAEDGEIMLHGGVVFGGYWNNPTATDAAIETRASGAATGDATASAPTGNETERWFHTGDIGTIDDEGFLKITGRKKELIVTAGGKNVSPSGLEDVIRASALVSQALVVGEAKPFVGALITIDAEAFPSWKERAGKPADATVADLADDPDLHAEIQSAVDEANLTVSHAEAIKKFRILSTDFSEESGEMTPTLKVKRNVVTEKFSADIEAIYQK